MSLHPHKKSRNTCLNSKIIFDSSIIDRLLAKPKKLDRDLQQVFKSVPFSDNRYLDILGKNFEKDIMVLRQDPSSLTKKRINTIEFRKQIMEIYRSDKKTIIESICRFIPNGEFFKFKVFFINNTKLRGGLGWETKTHYTGGGTEFGFKDIENNKKMKDIIKVVIKKSADVIEENNHEKFYKLMEKEVESFI